MSLHNELKEILKLQDTSKAIEKLVNIVLEMQSKIEDLEEEISIINEELDMLSNDMQIENYDSIFEAICPYCQEEIEINLEELEEDEEFVCPHCGKEIALEWSEDSCGCCDHDECDCGCDHDDCDHDDCDCDEE